MRVQLVVNIVTIHEGLRKYSEIVQYLTAHKEHNLVVTTIVRHHKDNYHSNFCDRVCAG